MKTDHATIRLGDYNIPLIGIPVDAALETCDLCGDVFSIQAVELTDKQILCEKCRYAKLDQAGL